MASLRPPLPGVPPLPNFQVLSYGIFEDMDDDDDPAPVIVNGQPFWGPDGTPRDIADPADVAVIVSVMENDNGTPAQYVELVTAKTALSLAASLGDPDPRSRATRLTTDVANVLNAVDVPIPFSFDDDHIGTQQLRLERTDLLTGGSKDKRLVMAATEASSSLSCVSSSVVGSTTCRVQARWRSRRTPARPAGTPPRRTCSTSPTSAPTGRSTSVSSASPSGGEFCECSRPDLASSPVVDRIPCGKLHHTLDPGQVRIDPPGLQRVEECGWVHRPAHLAAGAEERRHHQAVLERQDLR